MANRFDLRRSPVDGKFRRWEQRWASTINDAQGNPAFADEYDAYRAGIKSYDYKVWVVTAVYGSRREAFA
jgi:hypothetical protein